MDFHCRVILTCANKIEAMYERSRVNVKLEPRSIIYAREILELILLVSHIKGYNLPSKCIGTDTCPTVAPREDNRPAASFTVVIIFMSASGMWNPSFSSPIRRPEMLPVSCRGLKGDRETVWLTCMTVRKSKSSEKNHVTKTKRQKSETWKRMNLFGESCVLWSEKSPCYFVSNSLNAVGMSWPRLDFLIDFVEQYSVLFNKHCSV